MRTERRRAPSSHSRTTGTSAPTDRTTVTAATPRFIRRRAPSPIRRRTACRARSRYARPSRTGPSARPRGRAAVSDPRYRLRGQRSRCRRATSIATTRRQDGRPKATTLVGQRAEPAAEWQGPPPVTHAERDDGPAPLPPRRNPPRDWAAPPPWATGPGMSSGAGTAGAAAAAGAAGAGRHRRSSSPTPRRAGSPAARPIALPAANRSSIRLASRRTMRRAATHGSRRSRPNGPRNPTPSSPASWDPPARASGRTVCPTGVRGRSDQGTSSRPPSRPPNRDQHDGAPSWEQPRRYEAYPKIKARAAIPGLPRLGVMAAALGIAALALFFLPSILDLSAGRDRWRPGSRQRVAGAQCGPRIGGPVADGPACPDAQGLHRQIGRHDVEDREAL